jgi:Family of unknown function (DUF5643)/Domain of unknown function (DUF4179)
MNNQIPDIKETIEKIEVPIDKLDKIIDVAIDRAKTKHKKPKRKLYPLIGVASLATCMLIGSAFVSPAMAKVLSSIPVLNSVFDFAGDKGLKIASEKGLSNDINRTVIDQNVSLTVKDIFYDGTRLSIGYVQKSTVEIDELELPDVKINGQKINFSASTTGEYMSDNEYAGIINIDPTEELPSEFNLSLAFYKVGNINGEWLFEIPVEKSKENVKTYLPMKIKSFNETNITVKSIKMGPAGIKLSVEVSSPIGTDPLIIDGQSLQFNLLNDKGEALASLGGSGSGEDIDGKSVIDMEYRYDPLEKGSKYLTVSPYLIPEPDGEIPPRVAKQLRLNELPFTLDQGEIGEIIITDVKYQTDKTLLYFKVNSNFPFDDHFNLNRVWIEDKNGTDLTDDKKSFPNRVKQNTYVQEFQHINENEPLKVVTFKMPNLEVLKKMEIKIPLK